MQVEWQKMMQSSCGYAISQLMAWHLAYDVLWQECQLLQNCGHCCWSLLLKLRGSMLCTCESVVAKVLAWSRLRLFRV